MLNVLRLKGREPNAEGEIMINLKEIQLEEITKLLSLVRKERFIKEGRLLVLNFTKELLEYETMERSPRKGFWTRSNEAKIKLTERINYKDIPDEVCKEFYIMEFKEKNFNEYSKLICSFIDNVNSYIRLFKIDENMDIIKKIERDIEKEFEEVLMLEKLAFDCNSTNHYRCLNQVHVKLTRLLQDFYSCYNKKM